MYFSTVRAFWSWWSNIELLGEEPSQKLFCVSPHVVYLHLVVHQVLVFPSRDAARVIEEDDLLLVLVLLSQLSHLQL